MKKMVIILPRGESIKNFVYSGITDKLREEYKIIFYSIIPNIEIKEYLISKCDEFYELPEESSSNKYADELKKIVQLAHLYRLNCVTGNLKILKDDISSKKSIKNRAVRIFRRLIAKLYTSDGKILRLTNRYIKANFSNAEVLGFEKELKLIQPDIVFNTSHIHNLLSLDLMYAAKKLNLKTATFLFSWDNLTSQGRILPDYDFYFTWNKKIKDDLLNYYPNLSSKNIFVTGTPQFDFHFNEDYIMSKDELYKYLKLEPQKKIVLYSTGMSYYTPKEYVIVKDIQERLKKIDENLVLVVRIYAKDDNTEYYKLREETKDIVIPDHFWELNHLTPTIKDITLFNSLLNHCLVGINVASTVSLDLAVLDKPVINVAYNPPGENVYPNDYLKIYEFDHYKPIIESGAISLAKTPEELEVFIKKNALNPNFLRSERKALVSSFFGPILKEDKLLLFTDLFEKIIKTN
ncbi:hypothetical protein [Flavicella sp.]|uniref:hypothetical protein n=1 Tax=Flavicella sp. TaxID=2957742 RepID=UPI00261BCBD1|nr:hypothetical protein [Flavicella sp.]MDG1804977.1 hypothetical protein [Flavicella sp.]